MRFLAIYSNNLDQFIKSASLN
ncbi:hypothetical protein ACLB1O_03240 [Escherichia coli]